MIGHFEVMVGAVTYVVLVPLDADFNQFDYILS